MLLSSKQILGSQKLFVSGLITFKFKFTETKINLHPHLPKQNYYFGKHPSAAPSVLLSCGDALR